jgi:hypothetical protein
MEIQIMTTTNTTTKQTPYERGFYDGSRGLTAAYYPPQPGNPYAEYSQGFDEGRIERDRLNSRPINPALKPETEDGKTTS